MRFLSLVLTVSLVFAPGCAVLAVAPVVGAGGGATFALTRKPISGTTVTSHAFVGALLGVVVDVVGLLVLVRSLGRIGGTCSGCD
jgi:hypothetical protein